MTTIEIGGVEYRVDLPFKLDVLEDAADSIDEFNRLNRDLQAIVTAGEDIPTKHLAKLLGSAVEALSFAIIKAEPSVTLETLRQGVSMADSRRLAVALSQALTGSGVTSGEIKAPAPAPTTKPTRSRSPRKSAG